MQPQPCFGCQIVISKAKLAVVTKREPAPLNKTAYKASIKKNLDRSKSTFTNMEKSRAGSPSPSTLACEAGVRWRWTVGLPAAWALDWSPALHHVGEDTKDAY